MIIDGVHTKKLVIESAGAVFVRKRCEMHNAPRILLHDIAAQLTAHMETVILLSKGKIRPEVKENVL